MRIGLFSDTYLPEVNGVATSTATLKNELEKHGHTVYVVTTKVGLGKYEWEDNILRLAGIELKFLYGYSLTSPIHLNAYNEIKKLDLDLIHVQTEFGVGIFAYICAASLNIPIVSTYHTTYEDYTHYVNFINSKTVDKAAKNLVAKLSKLYGDNSTQVITPSEKTKQMLLGYGVKSDIYVVPTGLDIKRFDPAITSEQRKQELRASMNIAMDDCLIVFVGRIAEEKSIDIVIKAFSYLKGVNDKIKLVIVGGGPQVEQLQQLAKELDVSDRVIFAGKKPQSEVPAYYHFADAFVSASLTETQGMTYVEALASGLMVFARYDKVLDDLLIDGQTGYFFEDSKDLADKLDAFSRFSKEEKINRRTMCIEQAKPYDQDIFYEKIMQVYQKAIASYNDLYLVDKIKTKEEYVELYLVKQDEEKKIIVSFDTYFNKGIRKGSKLNITQIEELEHEQTKVKAYIDCVKMISRKDRTTKEIYDWLTNETQCDIETINEIVDELEKKNYINDYTYTQNTIYNMKMTLQGENKIIKHLKKKGIPYEMIEKLLQDSSQDEELDHAIKYAEKIQDTINGKSLKMKQKLIYQKLLVRGFSNDIINEVLNKMNFSDDENNEINNLKACAYKARRKYENKANSNASLRNSIFKYCIGQGYSYEDVYAVLDEMEWDDDNDK